MKNPESFEDVILRATEIFANRNTALAWLHHESTALGNKTPWSLLNDAAGRKQVLDELGRLEHGIVS